MMRDPAANVFNEPDSTVMVVPDNKDGAKSDAAVRTPKSPSAS